VKDEDQERLQDLSNRFPGQIIDNGWDIDERTWDSYCSMILISMHNPAVNFEDMRILASKIESIFMGYFRIDCESEMSMRQCAMLSRQWENVMGEANYCGEQGEEGDCWNTK
jgi:hypothetical protein